MREGCRGEGRTGKMLCRSEGRRDGESKLYGIDAIKKNDDNGGRGN